MRPALSRRRLPLLTCQGCVPQSSRYTPAPLQGHHDKYYQSGEIEFFQPWAFADEHSSVVHELFYPSAEDRDFSARSKFHAMKARKGRRAMRWRLRQDTTGCRVRSRSGSYSLSSRRHKICKHYSSQQEELFVWKVYKNEYDVGRHQQERDA